MTVSSSSPTTPEPPEARIAAALSVICAAHGPKEVVEAILDAALAALGAESALLLLEPKGGADEIAAARTSSGATVPSSEATAVARAANEARFEPRAGGGALGVVPVEAGGDKLGALAATLAARAFTAADRSVLVAIARAGSLALAGARATEDGRQLQAQLALTTGACVGIAESSASMSSSRGSSAGRRGSASASTSRSRWWRRREAGPAWRARSAMARGAVRRSEPREIRSRGAERRVEVALHQRIYLSR